jgi:hypothetical protein
VNPDAATTEAYVFPRLKYTAQPDFSLTKSERKAALGELRRMRGELLYELVVDQGGTVTKIRPVKSLPGSDGDFFTIGFRQRLKDYKFAPSQMAAPYRTFYFPINVQTTTEFLGTGGFLAD